MDTSSDGQVPATMLGAYRISVAFLALSWLFILLRMWTRIVVISNFGWDDGTMLLAGAIFSVYCGMVFYIAAHGAGTVMTNFDQLNRLTKIANVAESSYVLAMMFIKISVAIFFARIVVKRGHRIAIYAAITINVVSSVSAYLFCFLRCGPDLDEYLIRQLTNHCTPYLLDMFMAYQQAAFNTATDVIFVVLPITFLWNAQMERRTKISVGIILVMATLGSVCSMVRFKFVKGVLRNIDFFQHAIDLSLWSTIESGTCIIAACTATLRPLLKSPLSRLHTSNSRSGYGTMPLSNSMKSSPSSIPYSSYTTKFADSDPEYGCVDRTGSACPLTKFTDSIELVARPDIAHIASSSGIDNNTHAIFGSKIG